MSAAGTAGPWAGTWTRPDARDKATGMTRYSADMPVPAGAVEAVLVRSPLPHAEITGIATAEALTVHGVVAVVTAADLPDGLAGRRVRDMPLLARTVARFAGEPVAAVLARSRDAATAAAALVDIDYRELPSVTDPVAALDAGSPLVHDAPWEYPGAVITAAAGPNLQSVVTDGDPAVVARALAAAATVVSATYRTPAGHQGYLEPQTWVAFPPQNGTTRLWGTTKSPYRLRNQIAACLGLAPEAIQVDPAPLGGDFGGKGGVCDASLCVALARLAGRPVRLVLRSEEDLSATDARHPAVIHVTVGCDAEGRLAGLDFDAIFDGGAYAAAKPTPPVNLHGAADCALGYRLPCYTLRAVMGIGFACLEDLLEDEGQVLASNLGEFRLPAAADIPVLRTALVAGGRGVGPANVKAIGELTNVPVAAAVANAVADATRARVRELPITAERVYWAIDGRADDSPV